jgi:phage shock protein E
MTKIIIDVREPSEYNSGHVEGAVNLPLASISKDNKDISGLSSDQEIVVYCRSGGRAESARSILLQLGFTNVVNGINQDQLEQNS